MDKPFQFSLAELIVYPFALCGNFFVLRDTSFIQSFAEPVYSSLLFSFGSFFVSLFVSKKSTEHKITALKWELLVFFVLNSFYLTFMCLMSKYGHH